MRQLMRVLMIVGFLSGVSGSLFAASYDLKQMTPEVKQAISGRQDRYNAIQDLKSKGIIGETNDGYLAVRNTAGNADRLVSAENNDRKTIYQTIADQNQLGSKGVQIIETVFAEVLAEKSASGEWVESAAGTWVKKS